MITMRHLELSKEGFATGLGNLLDGLLRGHQAQIAGRTRKFAASQKDLGSLEDGYCVTIVCRYGPSSYGPRFGQCKQTYLQEQECIFNILKQVILQSSVGIGPRIGLPTCTKAFLDSTMGDEKDSNGFKLNMRGSSQHFSLSRYSVKSQGATRPFVLQGSDVMLF
ncbi:uncharacterized protein Bfra_008725 [Botrytis fragariae]|uniref:Uncharacterized protein n=1 Tax=Botrytis fragariae TaxID=1964551 RepID=A0A8H6AQG5_9HELO|nr:uncharacterized protein Bfra_008725 [Botrytis fragariae]KAF5871701.1 hypothetical protein Bfra_008725 [Botrytis fragariae]